MADRSTGPVQPPVIDLTARSADPRPEEAAPEDSRADERVGTSRRAPASASNWPLLGGVMVTGAVLGTVLTYLVAQALPLPARAPELPDLRPELAAQAARLDGLEASVATLNDTTARTQSALDETIARLDSGLAGVNQAVTDLRSAIPELPAPIDLAPIEEQLQTLKGQIDAIAAGASGADASAIAQSLTRLDTGLESLTTRLNGIDQTVVALRSDIDAARTTLSEHINTALPDEAGPALKLPLILSGLEAAFGSGRPYAVELDALRGVLPDFAVPPSLVNAATTGLARPDQLLQRFGDAVPDILAAREIAAGDWTENALEWGKSLLALRPAEEMEGDSPDAVVSRLEAAMARRDYRAATALIDQLPARMQDAAALVAADIRVHAEADTLVATLRQRALAETAAP